MYDYDLPELFMKIKKRQELYVTRLHIMWKDYTRVTYGQYILKSFKLNIPLKLLALNYHLVSLCLR